MKPAGSPLRSSSGRPRLVLRAWTRLRAARQILIAVVLSAGCATLSSQEPVSPEMLVGRWIAISPFPNDPAGPDRLLVIDSVTQRGVEWSVAARFSSPAMDRRPYWIDAKLEVIGRQPHLSFRTAAVTGPAVSVDLRMISANWLNGTFHGRQIAFRKEPPRAERPTYTLGDKWIRDDGVYDLTRIDRDLYIFAATGGREIHLTKDLAVARVQKGQFFMQFSPPPQYVWPLEIGKWGTATVNWQHSWGGTRWATFVWKVEAYEEVATMAGTFKAFRIVQKLSDNFGNVYDRWEREFTTWYAPEVRQVVKIDGHPWFGFLAFQIVAVDRPPSEPLAVDVRSPRDQITVTDPAVLLASKATAGKGVASVAFTLNGEEVRKWEWGLPTPPPKERRFEHPVTLREGKNLVLVTAIDSEGLSRQEVRTIFYEKLDVGATVPIPAVPPAPTPEPTPGQPPSVPPKPTPPEPVRSGTAPPASASPSAVGRPTAPAETQPEPVTPAPAPPVSAALPSLHIAVSSPQDQARVRDESVALAGLVSGGTGISRVVVTLNGTEVSRLEEQTPRPAMAVNLPLRLREGQNTLVVTATAVGGTVYQEVRTVHYERLLPLRIAFRYPQDGTHVNQDSSVAAAEVTSSKGVAAVSVTLNGVEVHQQRERTPQKSLMVTVPLLLREGPNAIAISATEPDGSVMREIRTVTYDRPKEAAAAAPPRPAPPPAPDRWAVVVGVGRYDSVDIPKLHYSVPDAEAIYAVLTGPGGFKKDHVLLLTDKTEKKPTYRNLKWALGTFLARSARKDDTVLIFFAGHGAPEVDQRGIERDGLAKYLVPSDAEPDDLYATALPMDELQTIFARIEAERVIAFLDSCYSGTAGGRTFSSKKTRASHLDDLFLERLTRSKGRAILTASRPAEVSIELPELGHGIFTYFLVQGLKGAADLNRDSIVTLQELYEYVEQQVAQKSRAVGGNQHPMMKGELEGLLPLIKVSEP